MYVEFRLSGSSSFRDMRGPKFTLGGAAPPVRPLAEKMSYLKRVLGPILMCVKFQHSIFHCSRDIKGVPNFTMGVKYSLKLASHFGVKVHALLGLTEEGPS